MLKRLQQFLDRLKTDASPKPAKRSWEQKQQDEYDFVGVIVGRNEERGADFLDVYVGPTTTIQISEDRFESPVGPMQSPLPLGLLVQIQFPEEGRQWSAGPHHQKPRFSPIRKERFQQLPEEQIHGFVYQVLEIEPDYPLTWLEWLQPHQAPELDTAQIQKMLASEHSRLRELGLRLSSQQQPGR